MQYLPFVFLTCSLEEATLHADYAFVHEEIAISASDLEIPVCTTLQEPSMVSTRLLCTLPKN
jgi:hypothetical protein